MRPYLPLIYTAAQQPFIMLVVVTLLYYAWLLFGGTTDDTALIAQVEAQFEQYGMFVALISSFLEVLLLVGWYFPGSVVIFISVIIAGSWLQVAYAVSAVTLGMQAGYLVNYALGKYGWYRVLLRFGLRSAIEESKVKMEKQGIRFLLFTFWHPGLGSVSATVAGILRFDLRTFFVHSLLSVAVWNIFWGVVVYHVGRDALTLFFSWPFILSILVLWTLIRFIGLLRALQH